jgi:hypothetical protein
MKAERSVPSTAGKIAFAYAELLGVAHEAGLKGIQTHLIVTPHAENGRLAIVKATIETEIGRFEAIGDADPTSVDSSLTPHLIRVAEDRAKARALRDAANCGVVSLEELDGASSTPAPSDPGSGAAYSPPPSRQTYSSGSASRGSPPRSARRSNGADYGPMTEAQRRYLFRLAAGRGYPGPRGEEFLKDRLGVERLTEVTRADASALIDELVHSAPARGDGNGAAQAPHKH